MISFEHDNIYRGVLDIREDPDTCGRANSIRLRYMWTSKFSNQQQKICGLKNIRIRLQESKAHISIGFKNRRFTINFITTIYWISIAQFSIRNFQLRITIMLKKTIHKTLIHNYYYNIWKAYINPRSLLEKIITRSLEGGESIGPPPLLLSTHFIRLTWNLVHIASFICTFN